MQNVIFNKLIAIYDSKLFTRNMDQDLDNKTVTLFILQQLLTPKKICSDIEKCIFIFNKYFSYY
ncbi:hypothetical protein BpHYR1_031593 [Brachionus plicatilis]|uniref:Uncharacterized protein n=1 Tax=Brachionus plicatilis TaxID=10195 RepID=A0A3M7SZU1_BRAPC|nr:hypothetical protein BpHYR1_031593 [Brachionus plicatilis]